MFNVNISVTSKPITVKARTLVSKQYFIKKKIVKFDIITGNTAYYFLILMGGASGSFTSIFSILGLRMSFSVNDIVQ